MPYTGTISLLLYHDFIRDTAGPPWTALRSRADRSLATFLSLHMWELGYILQQRYCVVMTKPHIRKVMKRGRLGPCVFSLLDDAIHLLRTAGS